MMKEVSSVGQVVELMGSYPSKLKDRYSLLSVIGSGGMGVVWRAFDQTLRRQVACKVLSGSDVSDPVFQRRFQREAHHIASLSHPNIVTVYDSGIDGQFSFIVMEYVTGPSLRQAMSTSNTLTVGAVVAIAIQVLAALGHAHERGIVHRDVKPSNLLLQGDGTVKVADFGIAKSLGDVTELTAAGGFVGTSTYASPEQLAGQSVGPQSDLYSLACVLVQCLSAQSPFTAGSGADHIQRQNADPPSVPSLAPDIPNDISFAIARSLAKDPLDRFPSAHEMRMAFLPYANEVELSEWTSQFAPVEGVQGPDTTESQETPHLPSSLHNAGTVATTLTTSARRATPRLNRRTFAIVAAIVVLVVASALILLFVGGNNRGPVKSRSALQSGQFLQPGQAIESSNKHYSLVMQTDGNLVDYHRPGNQAVWESGTSGNFGAYLVMQADGDLVVYPHGKSAPAPGGPTSALWSSGTFGHGGAFASLSNSGVLVVRSKSTDRVLWKASVSASRS